MLTKIYPKKVNQFNKYGTKAASYRARRLGAFDCWTFFSKPAAVKIKMFILVMRHRTEVRPTVQHFLDYMLI